MSKSITLGGTSLAVLDELPAGVFFDLAEAEVQGGSIAVVANAKFLKAVVLPEDQERLEAVLHGTEPVVTTWEVNNALGSLIQEYTARPLEQQRNSRSTQSRTEQPSRVVSLSPAASDKTEGRSSRAGRSVAS